MGAICKVSTLATIELMITLSYNKTIKGDLLSQISYTCYYQKCKKVLNL